GFLNLLIRGAAPRFVLCRVCVDRLLRDGEIGLQLRDCFAQLRGLLALLPQLALERRRQRTRFFELSALAASGVLRFLKVRGALLAGALCGGDLFLQLGQRVVQLRRRAPLLLERGVERRAAVALLLDGPFQLLDLLAGRGVGRLGGERLSRDGQLAAQRAELL